MWKVAVDLGIWFWQVGCCWLLSPHTFAMRGQGWLVPDTAGSSRFCQGRSAHGPWCDQGLLPARSGTLCALTGCYMCRTSS